MRRINTVFIIIFLCVTLMQSASSKPECIKDFSWVAEYQIDKVASDDTPIMPGEVFIYVLNDNLYPTSSTRKGILTRYIADSIYKSQNKFYIRTICGQEVELDFSKIYSIQFYANCSVNKCGQAPGSLPGSLHECETYTTEICGTWTWEGDHYNAKWNQGTLGTVKVERWGTSGVVLTRNDYAGPGAGTVAHYEGQLSGNTIKNGVYTCKAPEGSTVSGTWYANW